MFRRHRLVACACVLGAVAFAVPSRAQEANPPAAMSNLRLPAQILDIQTALGDPTTPDRSHLLVDLIRRTYDVPDDDEMRGRRLRSLLNTPGREGGPTADTVPLPLTPAIWINVVFKGRATDATLAASILGSRSASLLYYGLLSLDDETRSWIAGEPALLADIVTRTPAAFVAAAPGLHSTSSGLHLPGGAAADPVWDALVGRAADPPAEFVRALLNQDEGRLAAFVGGLAQLSAAQVEAALGLASADARARVAAARRLYAVYVRTNRVRRIERRAFTRPAFDPLLFIAELDAGRGDGPIVPGSRGVWSAVFSDSETPTLPSEQARRKDSDWQRPADAGWLADQVFTDSGVESRQRGVMALFGARLLRAAPPSSAETDRDAVAAIRAAGTYPALTAALERAGITDVAVFARAARRAAAIDALGGDQRERRAHAQYQGALALVTQAAVRHTLTPAAASSLVSSLSDLPFGRDGTYDGAVVRWLDEWLRKEAAGLGESWRTDRVPEAAGPVEAEVLRILSGPRDATPRLLDWEGTSYRLDFARAQAVRLMKGLGEAPRPYLSASTALLRLADGLTEEMDAHTLRQQAQSALTVWRDVTAGNGQTADAGPQPDTLTRLERAARAGDTRTAARLAPALRLAADDLLGRGLMTLAYAWAFGAGADVRLVADDAADRHEFGRRPKTGPSLAWVPAQAGSDFGGPWHVKGTILDLDVALAELSLISTSSRPPPRKPSLADGDRRVLVETVALVDPLALDDRDRDTVVASLHTGRARLENLRRTGDVAALAAGAGLSSLERTLLSWALINDPAAVATFFSRSQLLRLGLATPPVASLDAWGTASAFQGCGCLRFPDALAWNRAAGRATAGGHASAFPDLNLRLAELLAELRMPAALLASVLPAATQAFVTLAVSRDPDDRRGLNEYVDALRAETVEEYLALLTTGGALVPMNGGRSASSGDR